MERVHETAFLIAADTVVLRHIVLNAGLDRCHPPEHTGCHRHGMVGIQFGSLFCELLGRQAFRFREGGRGRLGSRDRREFTAGIVAEHGRIAFRLGVAQPDALFDQRVVTLGQLLDAILAALQIVVETHALTPNCPGPFSGQIAFGLLAGADDRFPYADLDLSAKSVPHGRIEVVRSEYGPLQILELGPGAIRIHGHALAGVSQPHGGFLLELLSPNLSHRVELGEFGGSGVGTPNGPRRDGRGRVGGNRLRRGQGFEFALRRRAILQLSQGDRTDQRCINVVGVAAERGGRESER